MSEVTVRVGGRSYAVTCRDGEEERLRGLAEVVEAKVQQVRSAVGGVTEARQLLLAALLLADELSEDRSGAPPAAADPRHLEAVEALTARVLCLAEALESGGRAA